MINNTKNPVARRFDLPSLSDLAHDAAVQSVDEFLATYPHLVGTRHSYGKDPRTTLIETVADSIVGEYWNDRDDAFADEASLYL
uniref:hypothetical protein n=1 Tax=Methylobacterium sp. B34 TaxID=95563 RepID=UPI001650DEBC